MMTWTIWVDLGCPTQEPSTEKSASRLCDIWKFAIMQSLIFILATDNVVGDGETGVPRLVSVCVHRAELQEATPGFICNKTCPGDM